MYSNLTFLGVSNAWGKAGKGFLCLGAAVRKFGHSVGQNVGIRVPALLRVEKEDVSL